MPLVFGAFSCAKVEQGTLSWRSHEELANRLIFETHTWAKDIAGRAQSGGVMENSLRPHPAGQAEVFKVWSPDQQHRHHWGLVRNTHSQDPTQTCRITNSRQSPALGAVSSRPKDADTGRV